MSGRHEVCQTCAHSAPYPTDDGLAFAEAGLLGDCRCSPPEVRWFTDEDCEPGFKSAWPTTRAQQWCGQWFPRGDDHG